MAQSLGGPLATLRIALTSLEDAYKQPVHPLLPRPALFLFAHVASSVYLLEHAVWAVSTSEHESSTNVEVFRRWVLEGGLDATLEDVRRTKKLQVDRARMDSQIVYGSTAKASGSAKL